jgi:hypothetical protein
MRLGIGIAGVAFVIAFTAVAIPLFNGAKLEAVLQLQPGPMFYCG